MDYSLSRILNSEKAQYFGNWLFPSSGEGKEGGGRWKQIQLPKHAI
jgi:hypothetical protein